MKSDDYPIKQCPMCGQKLTIWDLANDPAVRPIGMSFDEDMRYNLFFFQHDVEGCGTCFTVPVLELSALIEEPLPANALTGTDKCERHCEKINDLSACKQACRYAPFRRLLISLQKRRADKAPTAR